MKRCYSKLEGMKVKVITYRGRLSCTVTGADYSLGLTIQQNNKAKTYICCVNGPKSPVIKSVMFNSAQHKFVMQYIYDTLIAGKTLNINELIIFINKANLVFGTSPSAKTCAFSQ